MERKGKSKDPELIIGEIPYANLFPVFYYLREKCDCSNYKFVKGVPSEINKMLRAGKIDVSPSSSIEYLRHKNNYSIIPWFSIGATGPICSIFLFSRLPISELNKKTIAVSSHSETSAMLLKIILRDFLSLSCKFRKINSGSLKKTLSSFPACLLIGDEAMKAKKLSTVNSQQINPPSPPFSKGGVGRFLYIYYLGELWFKHTKLPFVFALWIAKNKTLEQKRGLFNQLASDLIKAKAYTGKNLSLIAECAPQNKWFGAKELVSYWQGISYDFTDKHMEGLRLFEKYALKHSLR